MNINIAENLKRLRKEKGITQEDLANFIGMSFQAVSKWERNEGYPDITTLPSLANFFDVSVDELIGMDEIRNQQHLRDTFKLVHEYEDAGNYHEAANVLRKAIKIFPNNYGLLSELALSLSFGDVSAKEGITDAKEAITLCERVLAGCTNEKVRGTTRANLCFLYKNIGEHQRAVDLARTLPHIWESREMIVPELLDGRERIDALRKSILSSLSIICEKIDAFEHAERATSKAERIIALGMQDDKYTFENIPETIDKIIEFMQ